MHPKYLVVALGNPGIQFINTRHNAGFIVIDKIFEKSKFKLNKNFEAYELNLKDYLIIKPITFMNHSGDSVYKYVKAYKFDIENIIVIHDDVAFPVGTNKLKKGGSSGGHKGLQSIIDAFGRNDFIRLRVGVGNKKGNTILGDWVLEPLSIQDIDIIENSCDEISKILNLITKNEYDKAVAQFNKKKLKITTL